VRAPLLSLLLSLVGLACGAEPTTPPDAGPDARDDAAVSCADDPLQDACLPPEPDYEGPSAEIRILRDASGIPHVYAATDADAYFGSGYAQATDRLLQMELTRRRALGRRAEILGPSFADDDRTLRILDLPRWAELNRRQMLVESREDYALVQAWTAGINRRIDEIARGEAPLPLGFEELGFRPEPWTESDGFAVGKLILFGNASLIDYEVLASVVRTYLPSLYETLPLLEPMQPAFVLPPEERPGMARTFVEPALPRVEASLDRPELLGEGFAARFAAFRSHLREALGARGASNNWAIDGRHTASGRPLIAGDPHQGLSSPSLMWMHHMNSADAGGALDVNGFCFVGTPAIQLGHNRRIAWTATTTYPDWMDLWAVQLDAGAGTIRFGDATYPVVTRRETISVAGEGERTIEVEDVPGIGVLLPDDFFPIALDTRPRRRILLGWTGFRPTHEAQGFHGFDVAATLDDFADAADRNEVGAFNFLAVDASGLVYRSSPLTPVRRGVVGTEGVQPWTVLDGDLEDAVWDGTFLVPGLTLPASRGGTRGWLASANNEPFGMLADGSALGDPHYFGVVFDPGTRAHRIEAELTRLVERGDLTRQDMFTLQDDSYFEVADFLLPALLEAWDARATDPSLSALRDRSDLAALVERLRTWDRRMERASSEAVVAFAYAHFLARAVLADDMPLVFEPILSASPMFIQKFLAIAVTDRDPAYFDEGVSLLLVQALDETAGWLETRFGGSEADRYTWGDYHFTCFGPIVPGVPGLDGGCIPTDGSLGTVDVSDSDFFRATDGGLVPRERTESSGGAIFRMVAEFDEAGRPHAFVNVPRGNSGDPASPHWDDLHADWAAGVHRELLFERAEIEASALGPGGGGEQLLAP